MQEEQTIIQLHALLGNRWVMAASICQQHQNVYLNHIPSNKSLCSSTTLHQFKLQTWKDQDDCYFVLGEIKIIVTKIAPIVFKSESMHLSFSIIFLFLKSSSFFFFPEMHIELRLSFWQQRNMYDTQLCYFGLQKKHFHNFGKCLAICFDVHVLINKNYVLMSVSKIQESKAELPLLFSSIF